MDSSAFSFAYGMLIPVSRILKVRQCLPSYDSTIVSFLICPADVLHGFPYQINQHLLQLDVVEFNPVGNVTSFLSEPVAPLRS